MAFIKLNQVANGDIVSPPVINSLQRALILDVTGRNDKYAPTPDQNLGTQSFQWLNADTKELYLDNSIVNAAALIAEENDVVSGSSRTESNQPDFIDPAGTAGGPNCTILAATTNLVYKVNNVAFTATTDIGITSLTLAPSANNTCLVNSTLADSVSVSSRTWGEPRGEFDFIDVDNMGSAITDKIGTFQSFNVNDGANDEYFLAFVESATSLNRGFRGYYYDSAGDPIDRVDLDNNDTISIMSTGWIFLENNLVTTDVTFNAPTWSGEEPTSPVVDDYWFDFINKIWKRFNGTAFVQINRTLIGSVVIDTADCIAARCEPFFANWNRNNTATLQRTSGTTIVTKRPYIMVNVDGIRLKNKITEFEWDSATDIANTVDTHDTSVSGTGQHWYVYLSESGKRFLSTFVPYYWRDRYGWFHPHHTWRCLGFINTLSGSFDDTGTLPGVEDEDTAKFYHADLSITLTTLTSSFKTFNLSGGILFNDADFVRIDASGFHFVKPGYYKIHFTSDFAVPNAASEATDTVEFRLSNFDDSITFPFPNFVGFQASFATPTKEKRMNIDSYSIAKIQDTENLYRLQARAVGGLFTNASFLTSNISVRRLDEI